MKWFNFFKKKRTTSQQIETKLFTLLKMGPFPNGMQDAEAGADMLVYIYQKPIDRDLAKALFATSLVAASSIEGFDQALLKEHLSQFKSLVFNDIQLKNFYNYLLTILTVVDRSKGTPMEVRRVRDVDAAKLELHYATDHFDTRKVFTEDEIPEWAWDASKVSVDLALQGIAQNSQAGHYDEIPEGTGKFGWEVTNPIPVNGIPANNLYLSQLVTDEGEAIRWQRLGSFGAPNIESLIDKYEIFDMNDKSLGFLHISPYHRKMSEKAPEGFQFR